jgi:hypothetical protein
MSANHPWLTSRGSASRRQPTKKPRPEGRGFGRFLVRRPYSLGPPRFSPPVKKEITIRTRKTMNRT